MGQITNATQGKALAKANPAGDFKGILAANWHKILDPGCGRMVKR